MFAQRMKRNQRWETSPDTRNRTRDHLIAANVYSQMLCQLSYVRRCFLCRIDDLQAISKSLKRLNAFDIHPARIELATFSVLG